MNNKECIIVIAMFFLFILALVSLGVIQSIYTHNDKIDYVDVCKQRLEVYHKESHACVDKSGNVTYRF